MKFPIAATVIGTTDIISKEKIGENTTIKHQLKSYKRYSPEKLRDCVIGWVMQRRKTDMTIYCNKYDIPRSTLLTYLKLIPQLRQIRNSDNRNLSEVEQLFDTYLVEKQLKRKAHLEVVCKSNIHMSEDEEGCLANIAILMAHCGRGIYKDELLELINIVMSEKTNVREFAPATMKTVNGFIKRNEKLRSKVRNTSSLDPARASQACEITRDCMFTKLENYVCLMNELGLCKEKSYRDFKSSCLYNMDECAMDTTRSKKKVICSHEDMKRLFRITPEGDGKMNVHVTIALTSRADGCFQCDENFSEGAAPPFIIHSDKNKKGIESNLSQVEKHGPKPPKEHGVPDRFLKNLLDLETEKDKKRKILGISVATTTNGSMTQAIFFSFCKHFVSALPSSQGKGGNPVILFLDGHSSRWNVAALRYLMLNNVYPFFLASHTTIWSQPNDNGTIMRLHSCIEDATIKKRRWHKAIIPYFNDIFVHAWRSFLSKEANDLLSGTNNTTISYDRTGLFPFNPKSDAWEDAIGTLGIHYKLSGKKFECKGWEIQLIRLNEGRNLLNKTEEMNLLRGYCCDDKEGEVESAQASKSILVVAKLRGDGILGRWRAKRDELICEQKFDEAQRLQPNDIQIDDEGDKAALKIIRFVEATSDLPLPEEITEEEKIQKTTYNILNNTSAGNGAVWVECLMRSAKSRTDNASCNVCPNVKSSDSQTDKALHPYCCSGPIHCIVKNIPDPNKHICPLCNEAVHACCGVPNPDFESDNVGMKYSTICMKCAHRNHPEKKNTCNEPSSNNRSVSSKKGIAFKRPDGQWCVSISNETPFLTTQEDLLNTKKYFVSSVGSTAQSELAKQQSRKRNRERKREEVKKQKTAKQIAENRRSEWLKQTYFDIIESAKKGNPWTLKKYLEHVHKIETPYVCTVGDYRVATGGFDKSTCFKTLAGELISGAIRGKEVEKKNILSEEEVLIAQAKQRAKMRQARTENTLRGSEGISAERRLTFRLVRDQTDEKKKEIKCLLKNIHLGEEVMTYIKNLKCAQETLTKSNVPVEFEYWVINNSVVQEKLKFFLRLWFFPSGGGKLSKTKVQQLDALKKFNLTKTGIDCQIVECKKQLEEWKKKHKALEPGKDEEEEN